MDKPNFEPLKPKRILFVDLDNTIASFHHSPMFKPSDYPLHPNPPRMYEEFFFETLPPVAGSLWAIRKLFNSGLLDIHILSKPLAKTHYSYSEKAAWIAKWFPELIYNVTLTQNKEFLAGDGRILVDDNYEEWGEKWVSGGGIFLTFDYKKNGDNAAEWERIVNYILTEVV